MVTYTIGQAAKAAGVTARAIRLYESKKLISAPDRSAAGYRVFTEEDIDVLAFIRRGRSVGLPLDAIAEILAVAENGPPCAHTRALLAQRVEEIDAAITNLQRLRQLIAEVLSVEADHPRAGRCGLIEGVSDSW